MPITDRGMIFKQRDLAETQLQHLERSLAAANDRALRQRLERDLAVARAGLEGEREAAYHIDFHLKDSKNWAIIHDLCIEWNGRVAQIDHLLLNRLLEIYVIESKSFRTKVRLANGGWERLNFNHWEGIPSPAEQNERHIIVLKELLRDRELAPTRLGLQPKLLNVVAVQPSCSIIGKMPEDARVYRMDALVKRLLDINPSALDVFRAISHDTLHAFAKSLVECHAPSKVPITIAAPAPQPVGPSAIQPCATCGASLTAKEIEFCLARKDAFAGQLLCRKCQGYVPRQSVLPRSTPLLAAPNNASATGHCASCGKGVDAKVVAFCRFNSKRFGGRVLCRVCQAVNPSTLAKNSHLLAEQRR